MKRTLAVILAAIILILALPLIAFGGEVDTSGGIYEGEYGATGKRSGYGVWTYYNHRYEGQWENDMPNGEGMLYYSEDVDWADGFCSVVQGSWVNGFAEGPILFSRHWIFPGEDAWNSMAHYFNVKNGCPEADMTVKGLFWTGDEITRQQDGDFSTDWMIGGVAPWSNADINKSVTPATPGAFKIPGEEVVGWLCDTTYMDTFKSVYGGQVNEDEGTYEGEYDADGKRNGWGTWVYQSALYAGNWEDDMPNGEGTLYISISFEGEDYKKEEIIHGNWLNGFLSGAVEWAYIYSGTADWVRPICGVPYVYVINEIKPTGEIADPHIRSMNTRSVYQLAENEIPFPYGVPPWFGVFFGERQDAPWDLYDNYPTGRVPYIPLETIENTGMGVSPGNLANGMGFRRMLERQIAALGDWIFIGARETKGKAEVTAIYKIRADGLQRIKIYEGSGPDRLYPRFQVIGDSLYVGDLYMMRADDLELRYSRAEGEYIWNLVVDDWEYDLRLAGYSTYTIKKTKLDYSELIDLGSIQTDNMILSTGSHGPEIVFANEDWIYVYTATENPLALKQNVSRITKVKGDGSGAVEKHSFRVGKGSAYLSSGMPQIVGGRLYYMEAYDVNVDDEVIYSYNTGNLKANKVDRIETCLYSIDPDFTEAPEQRIPSNKEQHITSFHVTEDAIYYGVVTKGTGRGAIMRADLNGSNPTVIADGFETGTTRLETGLIDTGKIEHLLIAGNWMMFRESNTNTKTEKMSWYLMRLDGTGLHKLGEPYIPEDAPGITDSTSKWRYELLDDGSAMILGPGSKLKLTGKLAIPKAVDKFPVTAIGENAFYGYDGFTSVTIPKGVTSIGDYAFFFCKGLTGATIPEGVTHIGDGAFQYCERIKKVSLPASLTSVGKEVFANCPNVSLTVAMKNETFAVVDGVLFDKVQNIVVE